MTPDQQSVDKLIISHRVLRVDIFILFWNKITDRRVNSMFRIDTLSWMPQTRVDKSTCLELLGALGDGLCCSIEMGM